MLIFLGQGVEPGGLEHGIARQPAPFSNFSMRSPKTVPWAQPEVRVFLRNFFSKSVRRTVRTTTVWRSAS